jgi:D-alanine-D-alanine ligase
MDRRRIGVLMGGLSAERDVSFTTGLAICDALEQRGYDVAPIVVDRDLDRQLRQSPIDVAFLALHGRYGEDGCVQGMLEMMGIPYTGSGVLASALCMHKAKAKELFRLHNVPTPPYYVLDVDGAAEVASLHGSFGFPVVVKPVAEGSNLGVTVASTIEELCLAVEQARTYAGQVLVERHVRGKEVSAALIADQVLGVVEIERAGDFFDYSSRYRSGVSSYHIPARLPPARYQAVLELARRTQRALGCQGASRVDLIATDGDNEYVLEVNTQPELTPSSLFPLLAAAQGMDFGDLCERLLALARLHAGGGPVESARAVVGHQGGFPGVSAQGTDFCYNSSQQATGRSW